jgi:hypothetical protein
MLSSKLYNQIEADVAAFTYALAGRVVDSETAVNADHHVVLESENGMFGSDDVYRALYTAVTEPDSLVLFVAPVDMQSMGAISAARSVIDESQIDVWGVTRRTDTEIEFENGSRIKSVTMDDSGNSIRGFAPDFMAITERNMVVDGNVVRDVIKTLLDTHDTSIWLNTEDVSDSTLASALFDRGAYVEGK